MDAVAQHANGSNAGFVRVFETQINHPKSGNNPAATKLLTQAHHNYGHAGRVYAKYLAENYAEVEKLVETVLNKVTTVVGAAQEERLYVAGIACILAGAMISNKIGLTSFDVKALSTYLYSVFANLRSQRTQPSVTVTNGYDLEELLSGFMSEHFPNKLVTDEFQRQGHPKVVIKWRPQASGSRVVVHASQADKMIRIDRAVLVNWLRKSRNLPASQVVDAMVAAWGAQVHRKVIGGGTPYQGGQTPVIDVPASGPAFEPYLNLDLDAPDPQHPLAKKAKK